MLMDVRRGIRGYWVDRSRAVIERWQEEGLVDASIDAINAATSLGAMVNRPPTSGWSSASGTTKTPWWSS